MKIEIDENGNLGSTDGNTRALISWMSTSKHGGEYFRFNLKKTDKPLKNTWIYICKVED